MTSDFDALTSPTLMYVRERWWNDDFTEFLADTLRPRPGNRILDVGCGEGLAEVRISRLQVSQLSLFGVDLMIERVMVARRETDAHNQRVELAAADACALPFRDGVFDSAFCIGTLQHVEDVDGAVRELARVTAAGGRVLAVEPDNGARYVHTSVPAGRLAFDMSIRFLTALVRARGDVVAERVGPRLSTHFSRHGIEPLDVRLFPVSKTCVGAPPDQLWTRRRADVGRAIETAPTDAVRAIGRDYLDALDGYAAEARQAGPGFVEIQNTLLFATVGQRRA